MPSPRKTSPSPSLSDSTSFLNERSMGSFLGRCLLPSNYYKQGRCHNLRTLGIQAPALRISLHDVGDANSVSVPLPPR
jgi:hypothetical protein